MSAKRDMVSTVSGHYHTDMYVEWFFGKTRAFICNGSRLWYRLKELCYGLYARW